MPGQVVDKKLKDNFKSWSATATDVRSCGAENLTLRATLERDYDRFMKGGKPKNMGAKYRLYLEAQFAGINTAHAHFKIHDPALKCCTQLMTAMQHAKR